MTECPVCNRPSHEEEEFCKYHADAHTRLHEMLESWSEAHGEIDWNAYLDLVSKANGTGTWILEVIDYIKTKDSS